MDFTTNYADNPMSLRAALVALVNRAEQSDHGEKFDWAHPTFTTRVTETGEGTPLRHITLTLATLNDSKENQ